MNTMSFKAQAPAPLLSETAKVMKQVAMNKLVGDAIAEFALKRATLKSLKFGLKELPINSMAGAVKALGQILPLSIQTPTYSKSVYDLTVEPSH